MTAKPHPQLEEMDVTKEEDPSDKLTEEIDKNPGDETNQDDALVEQTTEEMDTTPEEETNQGDPSVSQRMNNQDKDTNKDEVDRKIRDFMFDRIIAVRRKKTTRNRVLLANVVITFLALYSMYHMHTQGGGEVSLMFLLVATLYAGWVVRDVVASFRTDTSDSQVPVTNILWVIAIALVLLSFADYLDRSFDTSDGDDNYFYVEKATGEYSGQRMDGGQVCMRLHGEDTEPGIGVKNVSKTFCYSGKYVLPGLKPKFYVTIEFTEFKQLQVWIQGGNRNANWFVETISFTSLGHKTKFPILQEWVAQCDTTNTSFAGILQWMAGCGDRKKIIFPFHRWVTTKSQLVVARDSVLPQKDTNAQKRHEGILEARKEYEFMDNIGGIHVMTDLKAKAEEFSSSYRNVEKYREVFAAMANGNFNQTELDKVFGRQRLIGANPAVIERVTSVEKIKNKMFVRSNQGSGLDELLKIHLENLTIKEAIEKKRLYKVDYTNVLYDLPYHTAQITSPIALFFVDKNQDLMPVAIQLFKKRKENSMGLDNPIFLPDDDPYTWLLAKMWFNNADANYHQSAAHLGFTHLIIETTYIALRRTASVSHPLFRLLAPHFLYLNNINVQAWESLISKGGWVDSRLSVGVKGMIEIIRRKYEGSETIQPWRLNVEGNIENDIVARGVENLPNYTFRDDALEVFKIIKKYVTHAVDHTYKDIEDLHDDYEMQEWAELLITKSEDGGCGIKGLPFNGTVENGRKLYFKSTDEVITTISSIIYICSAAHASLNFRQYDEFGYPLNYPGLLYGDPPRTKKEKMTEQDVLAALPNVKETLSTMTMTDVLSEMGVNKLGTFEKQYQFKRNGSEPQNVKRFKEELKALSDKIRARNAANPDDAYDVLDPEFIPNSISI